MTNRSATLAACLLVPLLGSPAAHAQPPAGEPATASVRRPYRGLFGGESDSSSPRSLDLTGSIFAGYDDSPGTPDDGNARDPGQQRSGQFGGAEATLQFLHSGERGTFSAAGSASGRHYPDDTQTLHSYNGSVTFSRRVGRNTTVGGYYGAAYATNYRFDLFPALNSPDGVQPDPGHISDQTGDTDLFAAAAYRQAAAIDLVQTLGRRSSITFTYSTRRVAFVDDVQPDSTNHSASARFERRITQYMSAVLGYGYRTSVNQVPAGRRSTVHDLDVGLNYARALSFSRRTSIGFGSGSSIVMGDRIEPAGTPSTTRYRISGTVDLTHEMGRTWSGVVGYRRGLTLHDGFAEPFFTDGVSATLEGLLSRRVEISIDGAWTIATFPGGGREGYDALRASAEVQYALNRHFALFTRYVYYQYEFSSGVSSHPFFGSALDRGGVRVGLSVDFPFIR